MGPYRKAAEVQKYQYQEEDMTDNEVSVYMGKILATVVLGAVVCISSCAGATSFHENNVALQKAVVEASTAEMRAKEARALADKAMYEYMKEKK